MLRGMLSYLQGGSAVVTQAQANEVGAWGKCWESVGINLECPRGARHATFFLQGGSVAVTQAQVNEVGRRQMDAAIINEAIIITSSDNHPGDTCTDFSGG